MKWRWLAVLAISAAGLASGCRKAHDDDDDGASERKSEGIVRQLTGDPDDEVSDELEDRVYDANSRSENDPPEDF